MNKSELVKSLLYEQKTILAMLEDAVERENQSYVYMLVGKLSTIQSILQSINEKSEEE